MLLAVLYTSFIHCKLLYTAIYLNPLYKQKVILDK